jgi:hypothetical protein
VIVDTNKLSQVHYEFSHTNVQLVHSLTTLPCDLAHHGIFLPIDMLEKGKCPPANSGGRLEYRNLCLFMYWSPLVTSLAEYSN